MSAVARCPRCRLELFRGEAAGVSMLGCGRCGGVWLDNAAARRIQEVAADEAVALADRAAEHAQGAIDVRSATSCPVCEKPMARTSVQAARVEIDACSAHGTWFDKHELHAVALAFSEIRSRRGRGRAIAAGVAVAGVATAAVIAAQHPAIQSHAQSMAASASDVAATVGTNAADVVGAAAEIAVDAVSSGALEAVGDVAIGAVGLIFSIFD